MKKIYYILVLALILSIIPIATQQIARADGEVLYLDNTNIYSRMDMSYSSGYKPTISNGKVTIVLPLINVSSEAIENNEVIATVDLGATDNTPFVYANYQKSVAYFTLFTE